MRDVLDGIAAVVNNKVITYSEVRDVVEPRERLLRAQYSGDELVKKITELRKAALQDLIDRELLRLAPLPDRPGGGEQSMVWKEMK